MAIDPYEPELAKRQKAFQIASEQLNGLLRLNVNLAQQGRVDFIENFDNTLEALRDYEHTGRELSDWLAQKK